MKQAKRKKREKQSKKLVSLQKAKARKRSILEKKSPRKDECFKMLGVLVFVAFYIESAIKKAIIDVMPLEKYKKRKNEEKYKHKSLGILLNEFSKRDIDVDLLNKAQEWTRKRNRIVHHLFDVMDENSAGLETASERKNLREILYNLLDEGADILKALAGLMIRYNEKMTGFKQLPPKMNDFYKDIYTVDYHKAVERFGLKAFGFEE